MAKETQQIKPSNIDLAPFFINLTIFVFKPTGIEFKRNIKICYHKNKYLSDIIKQFIVTTKLFDA